MAVQTENQGLLNLYTAQYTTNVELLLQQMTSKIRGKVREGFHVGKMANPINQFGEVVMKAPKGRFSPLDHQQPDTTRPWVFPQFGEIPQLIDNFDELQTIVEPKSPYVQAAAAATGRAWDDAIIAAFFASRQIGTDVGSLTTDAFVTASFQVADNFGSSSASGLSVAKIIEGKRILEHYHNDLEMDRPCMVIGSQQHADLFNQVQVVSTEFQKLDAVVSNGKVRQILGIDIVISERLSLSGTDRNVPLFVYSGMYLGIWKDMTTRIDQRIDLSGTPWQVLTQAGYGSIRLQPGKVVSILCKDSTGADITP